MEIVLSVLIATMPSRIIQFEQLYFNVHDQVIPYNSDSLNIEIITDSRVDYNIGTKRNNLLKRAKGKYIVFIDDDDHIAPDYISKILSACKTGADCIGISGTITTNGKNERQWHISKEYGRWYEKGGVYYRTPNHISPVRRELALQAGFPEVKFAEDFEYSKRLLPLLKTETIVKGNIYHYAYVSNK